MIGKMTSAVTPSIFFPGHRDKLPGIFFRHNGFPLMNNLLLTAC